MTPQTHFPAFEFLLNSLSVPIAATAEVSAHPRLHTGQVCHLYLCYARGLVTHVKQQRQQDTVDGLLNVSLLIPQHSVH